MGSLATSGDEHAVALASAAAARAAIAVAGSEPTLEISLKRAAEVLCRRFSADHASFFVNSSTRPPYVAVSGTIPIDEDWFRERVSHPDEGFRSTLAAESVPLMADLEFIPRSPLQDHLFKAGIRAGMRLALRDERGELLGMVALAAREPGAFTVEQLEEFRELTALSAGFIRRALLLEQMKLERDLLRQEAELLSALASHDGEGEIDQAIVDGLRSALRADEVYIVARHFSSDVLTPVTSPSGALPAAQWSSLQAAIQRPGNEPLLEPSPVQCYVNNDLSVSAHAPVEAWLRDQHAHRSLAVASGLIEDSRRFVVAAMRRDATPWDESTLAFFARIARVLELNIERQRTRTIAARQAERLDAQARLLTSLDPTRPLNEIARTFAAEIDARFSLECLAIMRWSQPRNDDPVLYRSPRLPPLQEGHPMPSPAGYAVITSGKTEYIDLSIEPRDGSPAGESLHRSGVRHLARIPIGAPGAVSGFVSVTWHDEDDATERLRALEDAVRPLALVIERATLVANTEQQGRTLQATADILSTLSTTRRLSDACMLIAERLRAFFHADHVALGTINIEAGRRSVLGFSSAVMLRTDIPDLLLPGDSDAYVAPMHGQPEVFGDLRGMELNGGTAIAQRAGLRSLLRARIELADGEAGLITVANCKAEQYDAEDAARLLDLARTISLAIDRLRLITHMAETSALLGAQTRILASLAPGATIESAGEVFVNEARQLFGATHALVARILPAVTLAALSSDHMSASELVFATPLDASSEARYTQVLDGHGELVGDLALCERNEIEERAFRSGLRTLMRTPIVTSNGDVTALITLGSPQPNAWDEADLAGLKELSS
ncbi:MAG: GAF domain-containing protein, partial [Tepidiformaceae bacterium]